MLLFLRRYHSGETGDMWPWIGSPSKTRETLNLSLIVTARKRTLGQGNIFTSMCQEFCSCGGLHHCMLGYHPPPVKADPLAWRPPWQGRSPPRSAFWEIRSTSGWYASYWNAVLLNLFLTFSIQTIQYKSWIK